MIAKHFNNYAAVGELIVSNYIAESINNCLQDVSATKASCIQNWTKAFVDETSCNQLLIDSAT